MSQPPRVIQIEGKNVSYNATGAAVRRALAGLGLRDEGFMTRDAVIAAPQIAEDAVVVIADAYHLDSDSALAAAVSASYVLLAPSVLRAAEAAHAGFLGATVLLPSSQQEEFASYIADGTVLPVRKIPAAPLPDALQKLEQDERGREAAAAMRRIVGDYGRHSFIYPPGHFSAESGGGKERLTEQDVQDLITLIDGETTGGALVVCGGRVDAGDMDRLREYFAHHENVAILSQNEHAADLPSAYTKIAADAGRPPQRVFIDALAGTTLKVIVESADLSGDGGLFLVTSERMAGNARREQQVAEHHALYGARQLCDLGKPWTAPVSSAPAPVAPDLATALRGWCLARGMTLSPPQPSPDAPSLAPSP